MNLTYSERGSEEIAAPTAESPHRSQATSMEQHTDKEVR